MTEPVVVDWWDDTNHPMYDRFHHGLALPWLYLDQGWPLVHSPIWPGRGLATEIGERAYYAYERERLGWWPPVLNEFEWMLDEIAAKGMEQ